MIEGVNPGEDPAETIIWSAVGYAPCSYAIPVWVGAAQEIPACLTADYGDLAPANSFAMDLKDVVFPIKRGNGNMYLDYLTLRRDILPQVRAAEDEEISEGDKLKRKMQRKGFDIEAVKRFNADADKRFEAFRDRMKKILNI